jgi:hypothetical protein
VLATVALGLPAAGPLAGQVWRGEEVVGVQVRDGNRDPLPDAEVQLRYADVEPYVGPPPARTDERGQVLFAGLIPGRWRIDVQRQGYARFFALVEVRDGKLPLVTAGPLREGVDASLSFRFFKVRPGSERFAELRAQTEQRHAETRPPAPAPAPQAAPQPAPPPAPTRVEPASEPLPEAPSTPTAPPAMETPAPSIPAPSVSEPSVPEPSIAETDPAEEAAPEELAPAPAPPMEPATAPAEVAVEEEAAPEVPIPERGVPAGGPPEVPTPAAPAPAQAAPPEPSLPPAQPPQPQAAPVDVAEEDPAPPAVPQPVPAPVERPEPRPAPVQPPAPPKARFDSAAAVASLRPSATVRTGSACPECPPGEQALMVEQVAAPAAVGGDCSGAAAAAAVAQLVRLAGGREGLAREGWAGPLIDPATGAVHRELRPEARDAVAAAQADAAPGSSCQVLIALLPAGSRFRGYRYEARHEADQAGCTAGEPCSTGALWPAHPQIDRTPSGTLVSARFENRSSRAQVGRLVIFFEPPAGARQ